MKRNERGVGFSVWIYTKLLALYPISFHQQYGREMVLTFRDICRREYGRFGSSGLIGLWFEIFIDLASSALQEHIREVRMLSERQSFIRIAGLLDTIGGLLSIFVGLMLTRGIFSEGVTQLQMALFILPFLLIAVGTIGYFSAGRHEREVNAALGIMLLGASLAAAGPFLMVAEIGIGWLLFPLGILVNGVGLLILGVTARENPGFLQPSWLPLVLGIALLILTVAGMATETEQFWGLAIGVLGGGWVLLGLLLLSGNIRTDVQPPTVA